jgi:hypothetical protein
VTRRKRPALPSGPATSPARNPEEAIARAQARGHRVRRRTRQKGPRPISLPPLAPFLFGEGHGPLAP